MCKQLPVLGKKLHSSGLVGFFAPGAKKAGYLFGDRYVARASELNAGLSFPGIAAVTSDPESIQRTEQVR